MKNIILYAIALACVFIACNSGTDQVKETTPETSTSDTTTKKENIKPAAGQLYACSMHPELTGKKDEKCSKCGMNLTVSVKNADTPE